MSAEYLSADDLREYEVRNAWIYEARERLYEQTKDMSPQEITSFFDRRAEMIRQEFAQHEPRQADTVLV